MNKSEKSYHKLLVWQKMKELLILAYKLTEKLPVSENFGLKSQMRRAVVSVISNFVEGYLKRSLKEKVHFMGISETSLLDYEEFDKKRSEVGYFLFRYKSKIN